MMPTKLKEVTTTLDTETIRTVVFGQTALAEKFLEWSQVVPAGKVFTKKTGWGLILNFIARGEKPICNMQLDEGMLLNFLGSLGPVSQLWLESYGVALLGPMEHSGEAVDGEKSCCSVCLQTMGNREIHKLTPGAAPQLIGLGCIEIREDGFWYYSQAETAELVAKAVVAAEAVTQPEEAVSEPVAYEVSEEEIAAAVEAAMAQVIV